jgi:thiazole tautomerase (transcriptional regulator TenI)
LKRQLHVVTTGQQRLKEMISISLAVRSYIDFLHIREKTWTASELTEAATLLINGGFPPDKIIINDRVDVASVMGVRGAHLGCHSLRVSEVKRNFPDLKAGASVHSVDEADFLQAAGADFLVYGNVFTTPSKPGKPGAGMEKLKKVVDAVDVPVIAIGGIKPGNAKDIIETGAEGIAVMSGIFLAEDPESTAYEYRLKLGGGGGFERVL